MKKNNQKSINPLVGILSLAAMITVTSVVLTYFINLRNHLDNENIFNTSDVLASTTSFGNAIQFNGAGVQDGDRVKIAVKNTAANIGATDVTIEFWLNALATDNRSPACSEGEDRWIYGNIIVDRDIFNTPSYGDFGISLYGGRIAFGVHNGSQGASICSAATVADGQWHHIAATRRSSDGMMSIYVDGNLSRTLDGPNGNISYNNARTGAYANDPFLVIGAEKHDYDPSTYPSYKGQLDELRISNSLRYSANFTRPNAPFVTDTATIGLYHFDESGTPTTAVDQTGNVNGQVKYYNSFPKFNLSTVPTTSAPGPTATPVPTVQPTPTPLPPSPFPTSVPTTTVAPTATPAGGVNTFLRFDGANDVMTGKDLPALTSYTIEGWVRRTADKGTFETIMADTNSNYANVVLSVYVDGGSADCTGVDDQFVFYQRRPDQVQCSGVTAAVNQWFHIAISRDTAGTRRFFVNGNLANTQTNTVAAANSTGLFSLGRAGSANTEYFKGDIDEVHVTKQTKYTQNFTPTTNITADSGSVLLYKMTNKTGQTVSDNSGNNRNGVLGTNTTVQTSDPVWQEGNIN